MNSSSTCYLRLQILCFPILRRKKGFYSTKWLEAGSPYPPFPTALHKAILRQRIKVNPVDL